MNKEYKGTSFSAHNEEQLQEIINSAIASDLEGVKSWGAYYQELDMIEALEREVSNEINYKLIYR